MKFTWPRAIGLGLLAFVGVPFALLASFTGYMFRPIDSFCSSIPQSATPEQVITLAKAKGFKNADGDENEVMVFNHEGGPMFRFICVVKFRNHKLISKETIDGD